MFMTAKLLKVGTVYGKAVNQCVQVKPQTVEGRLIKNWDRDVDPVMQQDEAVRLVGEFDQALASVSGDQGIAVIIISA